MCWDEDCRFLELPGNRRIFLLTKPRENAMLTLVIQLTEVEYHMEYGP